VRKQGRRRKSLRGKHKKERRREGEGEECQKLSENWTKKEKRNRGRGDWGGGGGKVDSKKARRAEDTICSKDGPVPREERRT